MVPRCGALIAEEGDTCHLMLGGRIFAVRMKSQGCVSFVSLFFLKGTGPTPCTGGHTPTDTHRENTHTNTQKVAQTQTFLERKSIFTAF